mmetsp:Transcript_5987/g.9063  ORF Transcript_5987/g.9063 Transcript_5987/m.9063 type:complete len:500 (-) Transcript_5987:290-1789(-)
MLLGPLATRVPFGVNLVALVHVRFKGTDARTRGRNKFIDRVRIRAVGGRGGGGCSSYIVPRPGVRVPSGGHGGRGGRVILRAELGCRSLALPRLVFNAGPGKNGGSNQKHGRCGRDAVVVVPCGTIVKELTLPEEVVASGRYYGESERALLEQVRLDGRHWAEAGEEQEDEEEEEGEEEGWPEGDDLVGSEEGVDWDCDGDRREVGGNSQIDAMPSSEHIINDKMATGIPHGMKLADNNSMGNGDIQESETEGSESPGSGRWRVVCDLSEDGQEFVAVNGGKPGLGNMIHRSRGRVYSVPRHGSKGQPGEVRVLELELRMLADVGLVGFPNAGKSSLLAALTQASPRVGAYPFTTLRPYLGMIQYSDFKHIMMADIPGLIEGAHYGRGLGLEFLRHIGRTKALVYVIDAASTEGRDPSEDLKALQDELRAHDEKLLERPALIVANKVDLADSEVGVEWLKDSTDLPVLPVSCTEQTGLEPAAVMIRKILESQANYKHLR